MRNSPHGKPAVEEETDFPFTQIEDVFSPNLTQADAETIPGDAIGVMESTEAVGRDLELAGESHGAEPKSSVEQTTSSEKVETVSVEKTCTDPVATKRSQVATSTPLSQSPVKTVQPVTEVAETPQKTSVSCNKNGGEEDTTGDNIVNTEECRTDSRMEMSIATAANMSKEDKTAETSKVTIHTPVSSATKLAKALVQQMTPKTGDSEPVGNPRSTTAAATPNRAGPVARNVFGDSRDPVLFDSLQLCEYLLL